MKKIKQLVSTFQNKYQILLIKLSKNLNRPLCQPTSIIISITPNCPLRCRQCDIWKSPSSKTISLKEGIYIVDKLQKWLDTYCLYITGGEPFLNQDLTKIIKYAENNKITTNVNTNGVLINQKLSSSIIDSKLSNITFSLDGANPTTHDYLRGVKGTFKKTLQAIRSLSSSNNHPHIYINSIIMKKNQEELIDLIKIAETEKVDGITFQNLLPNLASKKTIHDNNPLWPTDINRIKKIIKKIIFLSKTKKIIHSSEADLRQLSDYYTDPESLAKLQCSAGINNFIVDHQGDVYLCFNFASIGNIFKDNPRDIWLGQKAQNQREKIRRCQEYCKITACNRIDTNRLNP